MLSSCLPQLHPYPLTHPNTPSVILIATVIVDNLNFLAYHSAYIQLTLNQ